MRILGSELVAAITRNADYIAVERTADFLAQVSEEQGRYNNIDDKKLFDLGKKYGASNVCVAEITYGKKDFYMFEDNTDKEYQELIKSHVYYIDFDNLYDC